MYVLFIYDNFFATILAGKSLIYELTQHFWQIYLFGQTKIQNFVLFGHSVGTL